MKVNCMEASYLLSITASVCTFGIYVQKQSRNPTGLSVHQLFSSETGEMVYDLIALTPICLDFWGGDHWLLLP